VLGTHALAIAVLVLAVVVWVAVQGLWRKSFPEACTDPDVLAGRMRCHDKPDCSEDCSLRGSDRAGLTEEEMP